MILRAAERRAAACSARSPPLTLAGDTAVHAEPLEPPVTDLNVMTRRGRFVTRLRRCSVPAAAVVNPEADTTFIVAVAPLTVRALRNDFSLAPVDAARFAAGSEPVTVHPAGGAAVFWLIEIQAA